jgi:hypothetical protein
MIKKKAVVVCDFCGKELPEYRIITKGVPNEGDSVICCDGKEYYVGDADYCNIKCLVADICLQLKIKD